MIIQTVAESGAISAETQNVALSSPVPLMLLMKRYQELSGLERVMKDEKPEGQLFLFSAIFLCSTLPRSRAHV
jgi:hypothetical protein